MKRWIRHNVLRPWVVCDVPSAPDRVALTFDDGPNGEVTPKVLDVLERHGAKATFFCLGEKLLKHRELALDMRRRGHELANHSMTHVELAQVGYERTEHEFDEVFALSDPHGKPLIVKDFLRPPKGVINLRVLRYCLSRRVRIIHWSRDPEDFAKDDAGDVVGQFEKSPLVGGDIVLLHDKMPHSAESLDALLRHAHQEGLRCVTISELLAAGAR
jgi:peptidoglycan-N-acetylglucosamine deacetylase